MRTINKIIIHCSATPEGRNNTIEDIDRWHRQRGFTRVGYHYVIHIDGEICEGRPEHIVGAHCYGQNQTSIGICYIGGLAKDCSTPKDTRTNNQKASMLQLLHHLKQKYPNATVHGHNEFASKDCPCFDVKNEYKGL